MVFRHIICRIAVVGTLVASLLPQASSAATEVQTALTIAGRRQCEAIEDSLVGT